MTLRPRVIAIVPAAGSGRRMGLGLKKPFILLKGKPIIAHTLKALEECGAIDEIVIASEESCINKFEKLIKRYRFSKVSGIVVGGRTRFESVKNCLDLIGPSFDIILVHDCARPLIESATIKESVRLARISGACIVAVPESDTVKEVDGRLFVKRTLDRNKLYRAATPQTFRYDIIKKAYARKKVAGVTDDSSLAEDMGIKVRVLVGPRSNIKITTKEDIELAEALL